MKNQTDMIVLIVAGILTVGAGIVLFVTKRETVVLQAPTQVETAAPTYPTGTVSFGNGLAGSTSTTIGGRGGMMGGMSSGKAGMMGAMGGGPMGMGRPGGMPGGMGGPGGGGPGRKAADD
jgi:hypothetical protein